MREGDSPVASAVVVTLAALACVLLAAASARAEDAASEPEVPVERVEPRCGFWDAGDGPPRCQCEAKAPPARLEVIECAGVGSWYNREYLFILSRSLARSDWPRGLRPLAFIVATPLDIALLPFAALGGLFG